MSIENNDFNELKNDISILFKYHSLLVRHGEAIEHKNCAVKQQDFDKALQYRKQEVELFDKLIQISEQFDSISNKYCQESQVSDTTELNQ